MRRSWFFALISSISFVVAEPAAASSESSDSFHTAELAPSSDSSDYHSAVAPSSDESSDSYPDGGPPTEIVIEKRTVSIPLKSKDGGSFLAPITVGDKVYQVIVSFISSSLWVFGKESEAGLKEDGFTHQFYEKDVDEDSEMYYVDYLDRTNYGGRYIDEFVDIGGLRMDPRRMGIIKHTVTAHRPGATKMDGVLGLAIGTIEDEMEYPSFPPVPSPLRQMTSDNGVRSLMSLHLAKDGQSGELLIGDESVSQKHFHTPLTYTPVLDDPPKGWAVKLDAFRLGKKMLAEDQHIEVNLASNAIWAPRSVMDDIIKSAKGHAKWDKRSSYVTIDCDKREGLSHLVFEFNGVSHAFEPHEYFPEFEIPGYTFQERKCTLFMKPADELKDDHKRIIPEQMWSLGVPFFKKFYTVYETDEDTGLHRVGFARAKH